MSLRSDFYGKKRRTFFKAFKARRSDFGNSVACYHALRRPDNDFVFFTADLYFNRRRYLRTGAYRVGSCGGKRHISPYIYIFAVCVRLHRRFFCNNREMRRRKRHKRRSPLFCLPDLSFGRYFGCLDRRFDSFAAVASRNYKCHAGK